MTEMKDAVLQRCASFQHPFTSIIQRPQKVTETRSECSDTLQEQKQEQWVQLARELFLSPGSGWADKSKVYQRVVIVVFKMMKLMKEWRVDLQVCVVTHQPRHEYK